jgi:hypothetical protein
MLPEFEEAWDRLGDPTAKEVLPMTATDFDVDEVLEEYTHGKVTVRKHVSGSITTIGDGTTQPALQHLIAIRNEMGLPDKSTNTTRSLGAQIFGAL